jgi:hypothetical protein
MSAIQVRPVAGREDLKAFIRLPHRLYRGDPNWAPPLDSDLAETLSVTKNPFFEHAERELFLAEKEGEVVGRIAAIIDRNYTAYHKDSIGFFGFFEAASLFDTVRNYLRAKGMVKMRGPANPSLNDEVGMLLEGFDSPAMVKMPYNPSWYIDLCAQYGMAKTKDLYAYSFSSNQLLPPKYERVIESVKKTPGLVVRPINVSRLHEDLAKVKEVYNDAWSQNWDFAPMTDAEIADLARKLKPLIVPEIIPIVELKGEPVGISISLPDYNQVLIHLGGKLNLIKFLYYRTKINACRMWALGLKAKYRHLGLDTLLYSETLKGAQKKGYTWGEVSWILEDNVNAIRPLMRWDVKLYKKYRVFEIKV